MNRSAGAPSTICLARVPEGPELGTIVTWWPEAVNCAASSLTASVMLAGTEMRISSAAWRSEAVSTRLTARVRTRVVSRCMVCSLSVVRRFVWRHAGIRLFVQRPGSGNNSHRLFSLFAQMARTTLGRRLDCGKWRFREGQGAVTTSRQYRLLVNILEQLVQCHCEPLYNRPSIAAGTLRDAPCALLAVRPCPWQGVPPVFGQG